MQSTGFNRSQSNRLFSKLANVIEGPPLNFDPVSMSPDYEEADMVSESSVTVIIWVRVSSLLLRSEDAQSLSNLLQILFSYL